jgi:hypothetical protein
MYSAALAIAAILAAGLLLALLLRAPPDVRAALFFGDSSAGARVFVVVLGLAAIAFLAGEVWLRAQGLNGEEVLGVPPALAFGALVSVAMCWRVAYVWRKRSSGAPLSGEAGRFLSNAMRGRLTGALLREHVRLGRRWLAFALAGLAAAAAVSIVNTAIAVGVACAALGACLAGSGRRTGLGNLLLACWLVVTAVSCLTATGGAPSAPWGFPLLWLRGGAVGWGGLFADLAFALAAAAVAQRFTLLLLGALLLHGRGSAGAGGEARGPEDNDGG